MSRGQFTRQVTERFLESVAPPPINAIDRVLLYDFPTGRSDLLPQHREGLDRHVLPHLGRDAPPTSIWIGGLASRRGTEAINAPLARRRAVAVARYLDHRQPDLTLPLNRHGVMATSFGDRFSHYHTENSELYRSVLVVISRLAPPPAAPSTRPTPRAPPAVFTHFRIRSHGLGFEGGEVVSLGSYGFEVDYDISADGAPPSDRAVYRLRAAGIGGGRPMDLQNAPPPGAR